MKQMQENENLELRGEGELGDPIDPSENGPSGQLSPDEKQELLKVIAECDPKPVLTVYFNESSGLTSEQEVLFLQYLNALYQAHGGIGLKIVSNTQFQYTES